MGKFTRFPNQSGTCTKDATRDEANNERAANAGKRILFRNGSRRLSEYLYYTLVFAARRARLQRRFYAPRGAHVSRVRSDPSGLLEPIKRERQSRSNAKEELRQEPHYLLTTAPRITRHFRCRSSRQSPSGNLRLKHLSSQQKLLQRNNFSRLAETFILIH